MAGNKPESIVLRLLAVPLLLFLGTVFLLGALWPTWQDLLARWLGEVNFIYFGVAFLFFYTAVLVAEKNLMRVKFLGLMQEIMGFFFGPEYKKTADAVEILIRGLEVGDEKAAATAAAQLHRITGEDLGIDANVWQQWWAANRVTFLMARRKAVFSESRGPNDSSE